MPRDLTIEPNVYRESVGRPTGGFNVYEHGEYPKGSVLEGQPSRTFRGYYDTVEEAKAEHPDAVESGDTRQAPSLPETPPAWFDPANAGETW